jgi:hypothetical protein
MIDKPKNNLGVGLGLRQAFIKKVVLDKPTHIDWWEIHPENYIDRGGEVMDQFIEISKHYPIVAHGLSLSIGSLDPLDFDWLKKLKKFFKDYQIPWFSDHLCFVSTGNRHFHDLLPLPLTFEAVNHVVKRSKVVQDYLEIPFALENISFYQHPEPPEMTEFEFVQEIINQADIHLMLDINNLHCNYLNNNHDPLDFLDQIEEDKIIQIHIAGHEDGGNECPNQYNPEHVYVDNHGNEICHSTWGYLERLGKRIKLPPVLIERDSNIPPLEELYKEVEKARRIFNQSHKKNHKL